LILFSSASAALSVKIIKLTCTAHEDVTAARKRALPIEPNHYPDDDLLDADEYERLIRGSPEIVLITDRLLSDASFWEKSTREPIVLERYHDYVRAFGKAVDDVLVVYQNCLYDVRGHFTDEQRRLLVLGQLIKNANYLRD
jgi:hypothetical protein